MKARRKYILSGPGPDGMEDIYICTLGDGNNLSDLRNALKSHYRARLAKTGEGQELPHHHYSSAALIFG
jgi:hypothetical protein